MKKLLIITVIVQVLMSCGNHKRTMGVSQREGKELIRIWDLERTTGVKYYEYKKKWYTEKKYDSIFSIVHNQTIKKLLKEYPNQ